MEVLLLLGVIGTSLWVYFDAQTIGARKGLLRGIADMGPLGWCLSCLLLWILAFPMYLAKRPAIRDAAARRPVPRGGPLTGR